MTLPATVVELAVSGSWLDITTKAYTRDSLSISRGASAQGSSVDPGHCTVTINNKSGAYSPRNPLSPYYGLIGRNTQTRVSVLAGTSRLVLDGNTANYASTPDAGALDVTGDIDIQVDAEIDWYDTNLNQFLLGKWDTGGTQRSYGLRIYQSGLAITWTTDGATILSAIMALPRGLPRRCSLRATLDVDNGSAGYTATFYWSATWGGPWTQIGTVTGTGTTSIWSGTAALRVGASEPATTPARTPPPGGIYHAAVYNGIGGTLVANPDFTAHNGASSFADSASRTWTMQGTASMTTKRVRFVGEVGEWPQRWTPSQTDAYVPIVASGILRRLGRPSAALRSPMARSLTAPSRIGAVVAYWPFEDAEGAQQVSSALPGGTPLQIAAASPTFAADSTWIASAPLPQIGSAIENGSVPAYTSTNAVYARIYVATTGVATEQRLLTLTCTGSAHTWVLYLETSGALRLTAAASDGTSLLDSTVGFTLNNSPSIIEVDLTPSGANINWAIAVYSVIGATLSNIPIVAFNGTVSTATVGRVTSVGVGQSGALGSGTVLGHVSIGASAAAFANTLGPIVAWAGEDALSRIVRLCSEQNVPLHSSGQPSDATLVGPQAIDTLLANLQSAADADGGLLYEQREAVGLAVRPHALLFNRQPSATFDLAVRGSAPSQPLEPTDDLDTVVNDLTISRTNGGSSRATVDTGPLSTLDPPNGVGRYDQQTTLDLYADGQAADAAGWGVHVGTWNGSRYPVVTLNLLTFSGDQLAAALSLDSGDVIRLQNLPTLSGETTVDLVVTGYSEVKSGTVWTLTLSCAPAGPWDVAVRDDRTFGRRDTAGSQLVSSALAGDTLVQLATTSGPVWTVDHSDTPFDLMMAGEQVTLAVQGQLLTANPFLDNGSGWSANSGGTAVWTTAVTYPWAKAGQGTYLVTPDGVSASGGVRQQPHSGVGTVTPGASYTVMGWVYSPGGWSDLRACIDWYDASDVFLSTGLGSGSAVPAGQWTFLQQTLVAPASASRGSARVRHGGTPPSSATWYGWGIRFVPTATVTATSPQTVSLIRAVNGISKAQAAGVAVSLAQPAIRAL